MLSDAWKAQVNALIRNAIDLGETPYDLVNAIEIELRSVLGDELWIETGRGSPPEKGKKK